MSLLTSCDAPSRTCAVPPNADARVHASVARAGLTCTRLPYALAAPRDVVEAADGTIFVSEMAGGAVAQLTTTGFVRLAPSLLSPIGLREAPDGTLVVAEEAGQRVSRIDRVTGARATVAGGIGNATYLAVASDGSIVVSTFTDLAAPTGTVQRVDPASGTASPLATGLTVPEGIALDGADVIVGEWGTAPSRIDRVGAGTAVPIATGFTHVYGVAKAPQGGWYVADVGANRVVWVHANGSFETLLDDVAAPAGLFVAKNGDLLVAEHVDGNAHDATGYLIRISGL